MTEEQPNLGDDSVDTSENARLHNLPEPDHTEGHVYDEVHDPVSEDAVTETNDESDEENNNNSEDDQDENEEEEGEEEEDEDDDDNDDDDDEEDEEPKLKYARLTQHMGAVYRNGDATSAFLVAGDKMIVGTHSGNIHVIQLPDFQSLRVYRAHNNASVTSISISPYPPPSIPSTLKPEAITRAVGQSITRPPSRQTESSPAGRRGTREPPPVPNIPSNNIFIATSSMDGNVCVQSLTEHRDVQLRNFARPVQAVSLSPDFRNDRTYLSGGLAGNLILTVGAPQGRSTSATVGTAAAAASGWLGSIGIGSNTGKDTVLHSGEGTISTIKWSLSGKYVAWLNEHGIKIMRTKLHLEGADAEDAWKRVGHVDRPQTDEWEEMAGVWKGRAEWIDDQAISSVEEEKENDALGTLSPAAAKLSQQVQKHDKAIERLLVGWGGTIWIIHVHPGGVTAGKDTDKKSVGRAEIVKILRMDCIISGISLYTHNLLLVLAYCTPEEEELSNDINDNQNSKPSGGIRRRQNAPPPELRLIDLVSQVEVNKDGLNIGRCERLSSNDYHLGVLPASKAASVVAARGALEALAGFGTDIWNATVNPRSLFSSGASIRSRDSNDAMLSPRAGSIGGRSIRSARAVHSNLLKPGAKIFIQSPYDCILATKRDLGDHLDWLLDHQKYQNAWELLDEHPEIMDEPCEKGVSDFIPSTGPGKRPQVTDDLFEDTWSTIDEQLGFMNSLAEKEKRRIGELWVQELVDEKDWTRAAQVAGKVVNTAHQWENWVYTFAGAKKLNEIVDYMPSEPMHPPIRGTVYEIVLGHYIQTDKPRFKELLDRWGTDLFDINEVTTALENQLIFRDVREDSIEDGEKGRDWRIVMESLARLHEVNGRFREALKNYMKLQDADSAMRLIKDYHLADAVIDDVVTFIALRVPEAETSRMDISGFEEVTSEAINLLVDEAQRGLIKPETVVRQLEEKDLNLYLYFYFRGLWRQYRERPVDESISLVDDFADLAVRIFATFDRELLMDFLKVSTSYTFEEAAQECEKANYISELVYLYSKTGDSKRALYLIIDRLGDVSQAISFAKEQDEPDLWEDLLNYSMDKPRFIRALLEEVGTSINPITLVRRIPEGLEIPGLREGLKHIMKEHEIQYSISSGVARVLRSEVAAAQNQLRNGQRRGLGFKVVAHTPDIDVETKTALSTAAAAPKLSSSLTATPYTGGTGTGTPNEAVDFATLPDNTSLHRQQLQSLDQELKPGYCARCHEPFTEWETETLVGFACGHVFHITHLLEHLPLGQEVDASVVRNGDQDRTRGGRFVGSKVTHARLLRDRIEGGCPVCRGGRQVTGGGY